MKFHPSRAVDAVEAAIKDATSLVVSILSFDPEETQTKAVQTKFEKAEQKLSACISEYQVGCFLMFLPLTESSSKDKTPGTEMADAKVKDDEYVKKMKAHFNVVSRV